MKRVVALVALVLVVAIVAGMFFASDDGKKILASFNSERAENGLGTGEETDDNESDLTATPVPGKPTEELVQNEEKNPQDEQAIIEECIDQETGKMYYRVVGCSTVEVLDFLRSEVTAVEAVDAVECVYLGASMVVNHDDERIIMVEGNPFTAYELYELGDQSSKEHTVVEFDRNASMLYACEAGKEFFLSDKTDKKFQGYSDAKAYETWICERHDAVRRGKLLFEGYPLSDGYRGTFKIEKGFDPRTLQAVVLVETEENRYDWMLSYCDCAQANEQDGNGGGAPSQPTTEPTTEPTQAPTAEPTKEPTKAPTQAPTAEPTKAPTQAPTAEPTKAPTQAPTAEPTKAPTQAPTAEPTKAPTQAPTAEPTKAPTQAPTAEPTKAPTQAPTKAPENNPEPTADPTPKPTKAPENNPEPTADPTPKPTKAPENNSGSAADPTRKPTATPAATKAPVVNPDPTRKPAVTQEPEIDEGYGEVSGDFDPFN